ncbi:AAC(3) family N-acetyltransferase [Streptomyces sp. WAC 06738]|nr:AAC(3) family N-acetyltransferase [Streptomyces sp. WAC 06738]
MAGFFRGLGVREGGSLLVHASLGGSGLSPDEVRDALLDALGPDGTLVVPAFTPENSDTSSAHRARTAGMNEREKARFRASMPPFEPETTPCPGMGALAECVRTTPGAVRSAHPQTSFAGLGPRAAELLDEHDVTCHLGERSPLARLYRDGAQVLLLGVGFEVCSSFHLAEYRMNPARPLRTYRCVLREKGYWFAYEDLDLHDEDFGEIGRMLPPELLSVDQVAGKRATLFGMKEAVDRAVSHMAASRR